MNIDIFASNIPPLRHLAARALSADYAALVTRASALRARYRAELDKPARDRKLLHALAGAYVTLHYAANVVNARLFQTLTIVRACAACGEPLYDPGVVHASGWTTHADCTMTDYPDVNRLIAESDHRLHGKAITGESDQRP